MTPNDTPVALREWPTWLLLGGCYGAWLGLLLGHRALGSAWFMPVTLLVTLHSSLQHELLHGHPTRSRRLNELLAFPALGLFVPYRRFRALHIAHHRDEYLTDPYDDPESWYVSETFWQRRNAVMRWLFELNATLLGRVLIGPVLSLAGFWLAEARAIRDGRGDVIKAWSMHVAGLVPVLAVLTLAGIDPRLYAIAVAWPAMSILMIRTYIEHRASQAVGERSAVVEAGPLMSLLFLNNNLHAVHHRDPSLAWFRLPALWRASRTDTLTGNGGYHYPGGYTSVARHWLVSRRQPVVHPYR